LLPSQRNNALNKAAEGEKFNPVKKACLSNDISIETIKKCAHKHDLTINDVMMTVISVSLKQYFTS